MAFFGGLNMLMISYVFLLQLSELLSIVIPAIIFLILRYAFHIPVDQMKQFFKKAALPKIIIIMLLCEGSAFLIIYPLLFSVFFSLTTSPFILSYSILLLQIVPWIFKCKKLYEIVHEKEVNDTDHAIYR